MSKYMIIDLEALYDFQKELLISWRDVYNDNRAILSEEETAARFKEVLDTAAIAVDEIEWDESKARCLTFEEWKQFNQTK